MGLFNRDAGCHVNQLCECITLLSMQFDRLNYIHWISKRIECEMCISFAGTSHKREHITEPNCRLQFDLFSFVPFDSGPFNCTFVLATHAIVMATKYSLSTHLTNNIKAMAHYLRNGWLQATRIMSGTTYVTSYTIQTMEIMSKTNDAISIGPLY